ncbi:MAG: hypothetical protein ACM31G_03965 [Flavobacteriales bacterium]
MDKRFKKGLIIGSLVLLVLIIGALVANTVVKNKVKERLNNFSNTIKIKYQDINIGTLGGSMELKCPKISIYGKTTHNLNVGIELNELSINNVSYWDYLFNDKISIENMTLKEPKVIYYQNDEVTLKSYQNSYKDSFNETIEIETIEITEGDLEVFNVTNELLMLKSESINLKVNDVTLKKTNLEEKLTLTFKDYQLASSNMFYMLNDYENLFIEQAIFNTDYYKIENLSIKTKYSKEALSNQISVERDHFDLTIDSIRVKEHDFGIKSDSIFYFKSDQVDLYRPIFKIYRDKLVADNLSYKPLYSKSLRNLSFNITLNKIILNDASIVYTEKVKEETEGGRLEFSKLNAKIDNLSNIYEEGETKTSAIIEGVFMENTPIHVDWNFDVKDMNDEFVFKADIGHLAASHMNQFMEPNLNVRLNGEVNKTYYTINGNDHTSLIDIKLDYDNFDIVILKQNGKEKNKLLSAVINLFVSKDSNNKSNEFRHGNAKDVERDKAKSVFNYLWLNIKAGLLNAMTGDGEEN